jgi:hypothetical protein
MIKRSANLTRESMTTPILVIECEKCGWHVQMKRLSREEILACSVEEGRPSDRRFVTVSRGDICQCYLEDAYGEPIPGPEKIYYTDMVELGAHTWTTIARY